MIKFLASFFKNNGHLRGGLYIMCSVLPILGADLALLCVWLMQHRGKLIDMPVTRIDVLIVLAIIARFVVGYASTGFVTLRAYLDQHLSRNPDDANGNPTVKE